MKNMIHAIIGMLFLIIFVTMSQSNAYAAQSIKTKNDSQLLKRIDFNNAYIMGQAIKSGAVYLLKRKNSDIKSMLKYRTSYRDEILEDFYVPKSINIEKQTKSNERMFSIDLNFSHDDLE
jgi:hypothetical protein